MGINAKQLRDYVIRPVLYGLDLYSGAAEKLLLGTAAQESHLGTYLKQLGGPAIGLYQMEPETHADIWTNYLSYRPKLVEKLRNVLPRGMNPTADDLIVNLAYSTALCRIHYLRVPEFIPASGGVKELAAYWKKYYNTHQGKGTVEEFTHNYHRFVGDLG